MAKLRERVVRLKEQDDVIYVKVIAKLTEEQHQQLSDKLRYEAEKSGKNIILLPSSVALTNAKGE
jgi:hypothetical protein